MALSPEEMDKAAAEAEAELKLMSQHVTVPMARWWQQNYMKTGHKRLGRILVAHAKAMATTNQTDWAEDDRVNAMMEDKGDV